MRNTILNGLDYFLKPLCVLIIFCALCLMIKWGIEFWQDYKRMKREEEKSKKPVDLTGIKFTDGELKVGDRVKNDLYGKGRVISVTDDIFCPVLVEFDKKHFTLHNGKNCGHKGGKDSRCLYFGNDCEELKLII